MFDATSFAAPCEVSRQTITNYLAVLESTFIVHLVRPFSSRRSTEIVSAPKAYAFDTGFVSYFRGWDRLRDSDRGVLWEHLVLNEIQGRLQRGTPRYWRNKRGAEVDFVIPQRGQVGPIAIECNWSASRADLRGLTAFRRLYSEGENFVVAADVDRPFSRQFGDGIRVEFLSLRDLIERLGAAKWQGS